VGPTRAAPTEPARLGLPLALSPSLPPPLPAAADDFEKDFEPLREILPSLSRSSIRTPTPCPRVLSLSLPLLNPEAPSHLWRAEGGHGPFARSAEVEEEEEEEVGGRGEGDEGE